VVPAKLALQQLLLGNDSARVAYEIGEQVEDLGLHAEPLPAQRKGAPQGIELKVSKSVGHAQLFTPKRNER
jgi:hypothetical protein